MPKEARQKTDRWSRFVSIIRRVVVPLVVIGAVACSACTGGGPIAGIALAVSIAVAYVASIEPLLKKPRLALFKVDVRCSPPDALDDMASWFLRVGIVNYGLTPATDCVGRLLEVRTAEGEQLMKFDPLTLFWARQDKNGGGFSPVVIQGGGDFEYLDIAQVKKSNTAPVELRVVIPPAMTLTKCPDDHPSPGTGPVLKGGTYYLLIGVHADDAYVKPSWFEISCDVVVPDSCDEKTPCQIRQREPGFAR